MATKSTSSLALLLTFNLLFFMLTNAGGSSSTTKCPATSKYNVCKDVVNIIKGIKVGLPGTSKCCTLIKGFKTAQAASCLCNAIKANALGIKFDLPLDLSLILTFCGKDTINGNFKCA